MEEKLLIALGLSEPETAPGLDALQVYELQTLTEEGEQCD